MSILVSKATRVITHGILEMNRDEKSGGFIIKACHAV